MGTKISFPRADGKPATGYLAKAAKANAPGVVVIQEWWGLNDNIKDIARRFAAEGFVALAPDLYHGQVVSEPNEARKLVMALDMDAAVGCLLYTSDAADELPCVDLGGRRIITKKHTPSLSRSHP